MEYYCCVLLGFVGILCECIRILSKNGKLMATITTISILLNSILMSTLIFSIKSVIGHLLAKQTMLSLMMTQKSSDPSDIADLSVGVKQDIRVLLGNEFAFVLASFPVSLFSISAMVLASAVGYSGNSLSFKDLVSRLAKLWVRPFVTSLVIKFFSMCYTILLFLAILVSLAIIGIDHVSAWTPIVTILGVLASILLIYLTVVWNLAMVVSVIEESCYGTAALRKASRLLKHRRLDGFALNFLFSLPSVVIIFLIFRITRDEKSLWTQIVIGLVSTVFSGLVMMFEYMSFTVLYFQCKKTHGEVIELQGSIEEYSKIPYTPILNENIP